MLTDYQANSDWSMKLSNYVALLSFFLLFPGYLFYHQFVAMDLIPPFAAGLFGYVSLGTLAVFLALLPLNPDLLKQIARNRYALWVLVFLSYTLAWTLAHYFLLDGDYITKAALQSLETVIFWSCLFLIGLILPVEAKALRWSFSACFLAVLCFLLYFFISTGETMYYAQRLYGNTTDVSTYQGFARSVLVTLLLLLAVFNSFRCRAFFILGGVFILYLLISRSDFYAFLALSAVLCIASGMTQRKYLLLLLLLCLEVFILAGPDIAPRFDAYVESVSRQEEAAAGAPATDELSTSAESAQTPPGGSPAQKAVQTPIPDNPAAQEPARAPVPGQAGTGSAPDKTAALPRLSRIFEVLDISSSKSWAGRLALQRIAIDQIAENPLLGKFGGHVITEDTGKFAKGHTGRYAHNALSAWVTYGLAGFLLYVSLALFAFLVPARQVIMKQRNEPLWVLAFIVNFVCLLLILVSKPVYWPLPALGWGILAQALTNPATGRT